jgi:hypothetical protein
MKGIFFEKLSSRKEPYLAELRRLLEKLETPFHRGVAVRR